MRRLERLIEQVRRQTDNEDFSSTAGIDTLEILQYLNDAQDRLQSVISIKHPLALVVEKEITLVSGQESYTIPDRLFLDNRIVSVEISLTGQTRDYYPLRQGRMYNRNTWESNSPLFYIRRSGKILVNPIYNGSSAKIRVNYERALDDLDIRRGVVTSTTGTPITAINLDASGDPTPDTELSNLKMGDFVCVVDKVGTVQAYSIPVSSYAANSITVDSHTLGSGESISAGDYVVLGNYATTHSDLPDIAERYLVAYAAWKILKRDSSDDSGEQASELSSMEQDIVRSFADPDKDLIVIPIIDEDIYCV